MVGSIPSRITAYQPSREWSTIWSGNCSHMEVAIRFAECRVGLLGVMATRSGWETLDRYYDIKEVITRGHLDQLGQAFMPCSRGAVHMLIDDYKNDPKIKKSLEGLGLQPISAKGSKK